jgi:hypothetical protein
MCAQSQPGWYPHRQLQPHAAVTCMAEGVSCLTMTYCKCFSGIPHAPLMRGAMSTDRRVPNSDAPRCPLLQQPFCHIQYTERWSQRSNRYTKLCECKIISMTRPWTCDAALAGILEFPHTQSLLYMARSRRSSATDCTETQQNLCSTAAWCFYQQAACEAAFVLAPVSHKAPLHSSIARPQPCRPASAAPMCPGVGLSALPVRPATRAAPAWPAAQLPRTPRRRAPLPAALLLRPWPAPMCW